MLFQSVADAPRINEDEEALEISSKGNITFYEILTKLKSSGYENVGKYNYIFYCSNFAICPNICVKDLYNNFKVGNKLIISYHIKEAWG